MKLLVVNQCLRLTILAACEHSWMYEVAHAYSLAHEYLVAHAYSISAASLTSSQISFLLSACCMFS